MFHDITHRLGEKPGDPIALLVLASAFRDEMPWLYEIGVEAYRAAKDGTPEEAATSRRRFQRALEFIRKGPFPPEEMGLDPRMIHMLLSQLDHMLEVDTEPDAPKSSSPRPKRKGGEKQE